MAVEQAEKKNRIRTNLHLSDLSSRKKVVVGALFIILYGALVWSLIPVMGKLVVTSTMIPIVGFIFLFGFWGFLAANMVSFLVLLVEIYLYYGQLTNEIMSLTEIIYLLVLVIVAALISEQ